MNKLAIAGGALALACLVTANQSKPSGAPEESHSPLPNTTYAITKDCAKDPDAVQKFTLAPGQHIYVNAGLRQGPLYNKDVLTISGTSRELTVTPYGEEGRTVFPDKLTPRLVEEFPFTTLGTVAIGRMNGDANPSVFLACDINGLTQSGQPLDGQNVAHMPPMQ